ncbi:MAG TPA: MFS transporter, partial [Nocardioides sp.]|nr:MFS transporter [Nocardioides sp.]
DRRGVPLGVVSAVQELGSVLGPLFGALVLAVADWRAIFLLNLAVGLVLAAAIRSITVVSRQAPGSPPQEAPRTHRTAFDWPGLLLAVVTLLAGLLVFVQPTPLMRDLTWGQLFIPVTDDGRWLTPLGLVAIAAAALLVVRCATARRPLLDLPAWLRTLREADLLGAVLLALALGGVILAFATADPKVQVFSDQGVWYLLGSGLATVAFALHLRRAPAPLVPPGTLRRTPAWGAMLVSFFIGAALIAALIDIPLFARTTVHADSQLMAALVLVRFLVALPVGAVLGGYLTRTLSAGLVTAAGMACAAAGFAWMTTWGLESLDHATATAPLVLGGFGFGLALAPVNAAVLASTDDEVHGLASAFLVVARMVGMLVGISALTTLGLRRYYAEQADLPPAREVCEGRTRCGEFTELLKTAGIAQEHTVFTGAAVCAVVAGLLALVLFRGAATRAVSTGELLRSAG